MRAGNSRLLSLENLSTRKRLFTKGRRVLGEEVAFDACLLAEPGNPHDANAVKVLTTEVKQIKLPLSRGCAEIQANSADAARLPAVSVVSGARDRWYGGCIHPASASSWTCRPLPLSKTSRAALSPESLRRRRQGRHPHPKPPWIVSGGRRWSTTRWMGRFIRHGGYHACRGSLSPRESR